MRVLAGGDDQVHPWRQVLDQEGEGIVDRCGIDNVVVVEDENEIVFDGGDLVEQGRQDRFCWRWLGGPEHAQHPFSDILRDRLHSSDEVRKKARRVVIPSVQGQPGGWPVVTGEPFAEKRGLAEACRSRDEGKFALQTLVEKLDQVGTEDDSGLRWGDVELSS